MADVTKNKTRTERSSVDMLEKQTLTFGDATTSKSITVDTRGKVFMMVLKLPAFTNVVTGLLSINNAYGDEIWTDDTQRAKGGTYVFRSLRDMIPLVGVTTFLLTLSGAPGAAGVKDAELTIYTE